MTLSLPPEKMKKICAEARKLAAAETVRARDLARLLGKMNATLCVIPVAPLFCRHLQMCLSQALNSNAQSYEALVPLSPESREELVRWDTHMKNWNGKTLLRREIDLTIDSDAWAGEQPVRTKGPEVHGRARETDAHQLPGADGSNRHLQRIRQISRCC